MGNDGQQNNPRELAAPNPIALSEHSGLADNYRWNSLGRSAREREEIAEDG
jgi:hypothetical protein